MSDFSYREAYTPTWNRTGVYPLILLLLHDLSQKNAGNERAIDGTLRKHPEASGIPRRFQANRPARSAPIRLHATIAPVYKAIQALR